MTTFYSKTRGFLIPDIHGEENIPADAIEISTEYHMELIHGQANGKFITEDDKGYPVLSDPEPLTEEEKKQMANREIIRQIETLERDKQPRAMREFLIDGDKTRLEELHKQIEDLRTQLQ